MELKTRKLAGIFAIILFCTYSTNAQYLGVGACINYTSNGINVFYSKMSENKKWSYEGGLIYMINTQSLNANKENYAYYQTGYANNFGEHLSLNLKLNRRLFKWKFCEVGLMTNLHFTYHSILEKYNFKDSNQVVYRIEEIYWKPALGIESTVGLNLQIHATDKIIFYAASGVGYFYLNMEYESGWNRTNNHAVGLLRDGNKPNKHRGVHDFVGLDGMPMMTVGVKYKLWDKPKTRQ